MAAKRKDETETSSPMEVLADFLKENKGDHYNFEDDHFYKVPCSSLLLTSALGGGLTPGAHRFVGLTAGGKTSCALDFMFHFLNLPSPNSCERRGVYIKSEGRLSEDMKSRSGVTFVDSANDWLPGTCFVLESNIYEAVFSWKRRCLSMKGQEFFFITDSVDGLIKRDDAIKAEEDSITVGGGSLITSVFLKKTGLAMAKRGHIDIYISQIRDQIKINQYEVTVPKQGNASGGRSLEHQANIALQFLPRFGKDAILEGAGKDSKLLGHYAKCRILKTDNENYAEVAYPIRYKQTGGKSVWLSKELVDMMVEWSLVKKEGAWIYLSEGIKSKLLENFDVEKIPENFHGVTKFSEWIETNEDIQKFLFDQFQEVLSKSIFSSQEK